MPQKEPLVVFGREERYEGGLPFFFEPEWFPELAPLQARWQEIRDEILAYERRQGEIKGLNSNPYVAPQFEGINWSNVFLENFSIRHHRNRKNFPILSSLIDQVPNCTFAVISILSPQTVIKPHYGDTNGIVRGHLGLIIPASLPECGARVGEEERGWTEGDFTLFTEAYLHSTWNKTDHKRYVLVIDIVPAFMEQKKMTVCTRLLGAQSFNYLENRITLLRHIPGRLLPFIYFILALGWRFYLPIQRRFTFL